MAIEDHTDGAKRSASDKSTLHMSASLFDVQSRLEAVIASLRLAKGDDFALTDFDALNARHRSALIVGWIRELELVCSEVDRLEQEAAGVPRVDIVGAAVGGRA